MADTEAVCNTVEAKYKVCDASLTTVSEPERVLAAVVAGRIALRFARQGKGMGVNGDVCSRLLGLSRGTMEP